MKKVLLFFFLLFNASLIFAQSSFVGLEFSNDVWHRTDRYYTQGLRLSYANNKLTKPFESFLPRLKDSLGYSIAQIDLFQDIYTPSVYNTNVFDPQDRPYSATLGFSYRYIKLTNNKKNMLQLNAVFGIIGKAALGKYIQNGVHEIIENLDAMGWSYQLRTGVLLNFGVDYEKNLFKLKYLNGSAFGSVDIGSYKTNVKSGLTLNLSKGIHYTNIPLIPRKSSPFIQTILFKNYASFIMHDATLQGALFQNYVYGLEWNELEPLTFTSQLEYRVRYKNVQLGIINMFLSPEFKYGKSHSWSTINIVYWIN